MRLVAHVGIKDEVEVVGAAIAQLFAVGVDHVIACDYGSTDGTLEVLAAIAGRRSVSIVETPDEPLDPTTRGEAKLRQIRDARADWALVTDADEFWIVRDGTLRDILDDQTARFLSVPRYNVPLTTGGLQMPTALQPQHYDELLLCVASVPGYASTIDAPGALPWIIGSRTNPKTVFKPEHAVAIAAGDHWVVMKDDEQPATAKDVLIAHAPLTTFERFERKVKSAETLVRDQPEFFEGGRGWHWRYTVDQYRAGRLREYFERQVLSDAQLAAFTAAKTIRKAADVFADSPSEARASTPAAPIRLN
jgi:hypothetical protein